MSGFAFDFDNTPALKAVLVLTRWMRKPDESCLRIGRGNWFYRRWRQGHETSTTYDCRICEQPICYAPAFEPRKLSQYALTRIARHGFEECKRFGIVDRAHAEAWPYLVAEFRWELMPSQCQRCTDGRLYVTLVDSDYRRCTNCHKIPEDVQCALDALKSRADVDAWLRWVRDRVAKRRRSTTCKVDSR